MVAVSAIATVVRVCESAFAFARGLLVSCGSETMPRGSIYIWAAPAQLACFMVTGVGLCRCGFSI